MEGVAKDGRAAIGGPTPQVCQTLVDAVVEPYGAMGAEGEWYPSS